VTAANVEAFYNSSQQAADKLSKSNAFGGVPESRVSVQRQLPIKTRRSNSLTSSLVSNAATSEGFGAATATPAHFAPPPLAFKTYLRRYDDGLFANSETADADLSAKEDITFATRMDGKAACAPSLSFDEGPCCPECTGCANCMPPSEPSEVNLNDGNAYNLCGEGCGKYCRSGGSDHEDDLSQAAYDADQRMKVINGSDERPMITKQTKTVDLCAAANQGSTMAKRNSKVVYPSPFSFTSPAQKAEEPPTPRKKPMPGSWDNSAWAAGRFEPEEERDAPPHADSSSSKALDTTSNAFATTRESLEEIEHEDRGWERMLRTTYNTTTTRICDCNKWGCDFCDRPQRTLRTTYNTTTTHGCDCNNWGCDLCSPRQSDGCKGCHWRCDSCCPVQANEVLSTPEIHATLAPEDEVSLAPKHAFNECVVCKTRDVGDLSCQDDCAMCGVALGHSCSYCAGSTPCLKMSELKSPTLSQALARLRIDSAQVYNDNVIRKKLQEQLHRHMRLLTAFMKAHQVVTTEIFQRNNNENHQEHAAILSDHHKTGGINLDQGERSTRRNWAWGPSMETFNRNKNSEGDVGGPARQDRENQHLGWSSGNSSVSDAENKENHPPKPSSATDTQSKKGFIASGWSEYTPISKDFTVTYWATVESGKHTVHIPINAKDVCAPEKDIINAGMKKVWKWVQDKKIQDKVTLQDAFDLAKDMQPEPDDEYDSDTSESNPSKPGWLSAAWDSESDVSEAEQDRRARERGATIYTVIPKSRVDNPVGVKPAFDGPSQAGLQNKMHNNTLAKMFKLKSPVVKTVPTSHLFTKAHIDKQRKTSGARPANYIPTSAEASGNVVGKQGRPPLLVATRGSAHKATAGAKVEKPRGGHDRLKRAASSAAASTLSRAPWEYDDVDYSE
jgi:hypothetical protein